MKDDFEDIFNEEEIYENMISYEVLEESPEGYEDYPEPGETKKPIKSKSGGGGRVTKVFKIKKDKILESKDRQIIYQYLKKGDKLRIPGKLEGIVVVPPNQLNEYISMIQVTRPLSEELQKEWVSDLPMLQPLYLEDWINLKCEPIK